MGQQGRQGLCPPVSISAIKDAWTCASKWPPPPPVENGLLSVFFFIIYCHTRILMPNGASAKRPRQQMIMRFHLSTTIRRGWQELFDPTGLYSSITFIVGLPAPKPRPDHRPQEPRPSLRGVVGVAKHPGRATFTRSPFKPKLLHLAALRYFAASILSQYPIFQIYIINYQ